MGADHRVGEMKNSQRLIVFTNFSVDHLGHAQELVQPQKHAKKVIFRAASVPYR